jgi:small conductance mechanosensitive channel
MFAGQRWRRGRIAGASVRASALLAFVFALSSSPPAPAQVELDGKAEAPAKSDVLRPHVVVTPRADDAQIARRLTRILEATGWYEQPQVRVNEGVVFLGGTVLRESHREWAEQLASNTQDVVAVVNRIEIAGAAFWDLSPAIEELQELAESMVRRAPIILIAALLAALTWYAAKWSVRGASTLIGTRLKNPLLRDVAARVVAVPVFIVGLFVVLTVSGLTGLAVTVVGGTGLIGLIIGFAFRDIAENFLASVLISLQRPFATNDLVAVAGHKGFVQSVNTRATLLMTLEGNHVQIPNATIYKETITNFTANPFSRYDFAVGIGYDDSIAQAQALALQVLKEHPAVLNDPEPLVLAEALGASTVSLRIYFWVDIGRYSHLKVRSAVIRLTKRAFLQAGITMPDEAREVIFPRGVPVQMVPAVETAPASTAAPESKEMAESVANSAEGELTSEAGEIKRQAREARLPEGGANLLES